MLRFGGARRFLSVTPGVASKHCGVAARGARSPRAKGNLPAAGGYLASTRQLPGDRAKPSSRGVVRTRSTHVPHTWLGGSAACRPPDRNHEVHRQRADLPRSNAAYYSLPVDRRRVGRPDRSQAWIVATFLVSSVGLVVAVASLVVAWMALPAGESTRPAHQSTLGQSSL